MGNYLTLVNKNNIFRPEDAQDFNYIECEKEGAKNEDSFPIYLEEETYKAFMGLKQELAQENINLKIVSGRRTPSEQAKIAEDIYNEKLNRFKNEGQTEEEAQENAQNYLLDYVAKPLESEHHTGLCLDGEPNRIKDNFLTGMAKIYEGKTGAFSKKVASKIRALDRRVMNRVVHSKLEKYGFILRYKEEDYKQTGVHSEPWHYRFVGPENAKKINKSNLSLEEYVANLKNQNMDFAR